MADAPQAHRPTQIIDQWGNPIPPARVAQLRQDLAYPDNDEGRTRIMADIETMMRDAERRADALFDIRPTSEVIAQPYPEYRWESAAASYTAPPLDGSRPAIFQIPLREARMTKFGLRTLVYHETVPGHHFQIALEQENTSLPRFRQARVLGGISALSEGWALYGEKLVAENGWYEGDPEGQLGMLDAQLFRARRLVVDTGLHAKHWTRQQAIDYGLEPSEVERYVVNPGQACAYMIGQLKLLELRDKARDTLGAKFKPQAFHDVVLKTGTAPLDPDLADAFYARYGIPVLQNYGATEFAGGVAGWTLDDFKAHWTSKRGSVGRLNRDVEIRVLDQDGKDMPVGQIGEFFVRGPGIFNGYYKNPEANASSFRGEWFSLGDMGYTDEDGYYYLVDRKSDMIITGGENVFPQDIESVLRSVQGVKDVAVVGIQDDRWGEIIAAFVECDNDTNMNKTDLVEACVSRLPGYMKPRRVEFVDTLPRNSMGKVLRRVLRDSLRATSL